MEFIKNFFRVGSICNLSSTLIQLKVRSVKDLEVIIHHFNIHPLLTKKRADFLIFQKVYKIVLKKEHLTIAGLNRIIALKANMNLGLSEKVMAAFKEIIPVNRPLLTNKTIYDPH